MSIEEFIKQADIHASVEYGKPASVRKGNSAADKMAEIAKQYAGAKKADELLRIINHEVAGSWVAYCLANNSNLSHEQKKICISKIRSIASISGLDALGAQMWLREHGYENS
tara:strand:- start:135 stop:470 length:336 start_codon:yes stop_codon:yes gene_type:complete